MIVAVWISHCFKIVSVASDSSAIFRRTAPLAGDAAWVRRLWSRHEDRLQQQFVVPVVAIVVNISARGSHARQPSSDARALRVDQSHVVVVTDVRRPILLAADAK